MTRALRFFALETGASTGFCNATAKANDAGIGMQAVADHKYSIKRLTITSINHMFNHMVELSSSQLDAIFHALADPTRRSMLRALAGGERQAAARQILAGQPHIGAARQPGG